MTLTIELTPEQSRRVEQARACGVDLEGTIRETIDRLSEDVKPKETTSRPRTGHTDERFKNLRGYGKYTGIGSVDEFLREKRKDTERENKPR